MALLLIFFLHICTIFRSSHLYSSKSSGCYDWNRNLAHMIQPLIELTEILPQMKDMNVVVGVVQILFLLSEHAVHCIYTEDVLVRTALGQILGRRRKETYPLGTGKTLVCLSNPEMFRPSKKEPISPNLKLCKAQQYSLSVADFVALLEIIPFCKTVGSLKTSSFVMTTRHHCALHRPLKSRSINWFYFD